MTYHYNNIIIQYPQNERDNYHNCYVESENILLENCGYKRTTRGNLPQTGFEPRTQGFSDFMSLAKD